MIADIRITEKSFGDKLLMSNVAFSVNDGEKIAIVGRNGVGKSTLFGILTGADSDYSGEVIFKRGITVSSTAQEHIGLDNIKVVDYILRGLPEYSKLKNIIDTYPETMGENIRLINQYTEALERFDQKGFYYIEDKIRAELDTFQLYGMIESPIGKLSGGQKRLIEVVKIMHSKAHLVLVDEPTNHMDYVAKEQFINWMKSAEMSKTAMLIITHDRDVLEQVDRIVEIKDGGCVSYKGNYDAYLSQNATRTSSTMQEYEVVQARIANLNKQIQFARSKKAGWTGTADKRNPFVVMEQRFLKEKKELESIERPSFWIDKDSVRQLDYKSSDRYDKFKAKNIRVNVKSSDTRGRRIIIKADNLAVGYEDKIILEGVNINLHEGEILELRGRNGSGKTTLINALLGSIQPKTKQNQPIIYSGEVGLYPQARVGIYEQEVNKTYLNDSLKDAVEKMYLDKNLSITETKIRQLCADYLFSTSDLDTPIYRLSGGQKARFQIISMLANDPQLLVLDEPTNHLDLPSIEELEVALAKYSGAIIYVSHDDYFRQNLRGEIIKIDDFTAKQNKAAQT